MNQIQRLQAPGVSAGDLDIAARTVWAEARGEPFEGQVAVAHVICNRTAAKTRGETTLAGTCLEPWQFSCWNIDDPNRARLMAVGVDVAEFRRALQAVLQALDEPDPLEGARHYHADYVSPSWSEGKVPVKVIGRHEFYAGIA